VPGTSVLFDASSERFIEALFFLHWTKTVAGARRRRQLLLSTVVIDKK
jgi:hypothetical protein